MNEIDPDVAQAMDSSGSTWKQPDYAALRVAAEQATPGPWTADREVVGWWGGSCPGIAVWYHPDPSTGKPVCHVKPDRGMNGAGSMNPEVDAAYIAAADPQTILALLDERDADTYALWMEWERTSAAERRVAALEDWLREAVGLLNEVRNSDAIFPKADWPISQAVAAFLDSDKARALLEPER